MMLLAISLFLAGCASGYQQFYKPASSAVLERLATQRVSPAPAAPYIERSQPGNSQAILESYMKRGYIMIGHSAFNAGREESEDSAVRQGKNVGADLVLILSPKYTGSVTTSVPIITPTTSTSYTNGSATAYGAGRTVTAYGNSTTTTVANTTNYIPITINRSDYGAVYFVKQRFSVGVFTRNLSDSERQEFQTNKGAIVTIIVDGTPAFDADLLAGDRITSVDGQDISDSTNFNALLRERLGRKVSLTILRRGQLIEKSIQTRR